MARKKGRCVDCLYYMGPLSARNPRENKCDANPGTWNSYSEWSCEKFAPSIPKDNLIWKQAHVLLSDKQCPFRGGTCRSEFGDKNRTMKRLRDQYCRSTGYKECPSFNELISKI
jgi:hypothetical protein